MALHLKSHLNGFHLLNPQSLRLSSISRVSVSISHRTQFQSWVVCARRRKKRDGYRRITRFLFKSLSLLSINHQILFLPQPLDLVIANLGGLDGGGRGGGGGGFWRGWGRFDGWKRKRNRLQIFLFVCVILLIYGFSGKEIKSDETLKVLGLCLIGVSMVKKLKKEATYLVSGILCVIASQSFRFKKDSVATIASGFRSFSSVYKRTSRRRA